MAFAGLAIMLIGTSAAWLALDRSAPTWDDAIYLKNSLILYDTLHDHGLAAYGRKSLTVMDSKPPLIALLPTPFYWIAGRHPRAAYGVNLLFAPLLLAAVYRIALRYSTARAGLLAMYFVATMPLIYGLSRWFLVEFGLTALIAGSVWVLCDSGKTPRLRSAVILGALFGFGSLLKLTFPLYFAAPAAFYLFRVWRTGRVRAVLAFTAPALAIILPWYAIHFRAAMRTALETGSEAPLFFGAYSAYSPEVMHYFVRKIAASGPALYFLMLPALVLASWRRLSPEAKAGLKLCAIWAAPILFLLAWPAREVRYAAPLFPALAITLAIALDSIWQRSRRPFRVAMLAMLAMPFLSMMHASFGYPAAIPLRSLLFDPRELAYAQPFNPRPWPHQQILEELCRATPCSPANPPAVVIGTDGTRFNADTFALYAVKRRLPLRTLTTAYESSWTTVAPLLDAATFFIEEEGGEPRSIFFNVQGSAARQRVEHSSEFAEWPERFPLADGGTARVFERILPDSYFSAGRRAPRHIADLKESATTFGDLAELTGLSFDPQGGKFRLRWKALRRFDQPYWAFVHAVDEHRKVLGYLDHRLMPEAQPDDVAIETLHLPDAAHDLCGVEIGIYLVASGKRVPVVRSDSTPVDAGTGITTYNPAMTFSNCSSPPAKK